MGLLEEKGKVQVFDKKEMATKSVHLKIHFWLQN